MTFQVFLAANSIPIPSSHLSQKILLAHRAGNSRLCMGNTESPTCCRVIKSKGDHQDRSHSYTQYTQPVLNNLHNLDDAYERLFSTRLTISPTIPPRRLTQTRKRANLALCLEPSDKRQHKLTFPRSSLHRVGYSFRI